ncbi:MAG: hypothetical protein WCR20_00710 [Verrucomicrobiota bacterium]|nr:hypothetical protein [Verrucomicrobiota bacterium]
MKFALILGAMTGFAVGVLSGLAVSSSWQTCLINGCVGAVAIALLLRWWRRIWVASLLESLHQEYLAAQQASRKDAQPSTPGKL